MTGDLVLSRIGSTIERLRTQLGDARYRQAVERGRGWTDRELVEHARRLYDTAIEVAGGVARADGS